MLRQNSNVKTKCIEIRTKYQIKHPPTSIQGQLQNIISQPLFDQKGNRQIQCVQQQSDDLEQQISSSKEFSQKLPNDIEINLFKNEIKTELQLRFRKQQHKIDSMNQNKYQLKLFKYCLRSKKNIDDQVHSRKFLSKLEMITSQIGECAIEKRKIGAPKYINNILLDDVYIRTRKPVFFMVIDSILKKIKSLNSFKLDAFVGSPVGDIALIHLMKLFRKVVRLTEFDLHFMQGEVAERGSQALEKVIKKLQGIETFKFKVEMEKIKIAGLLKLRSIFSRKQSIKNFMISKSIPPHEDKQRLDGLEIKVPKMSPKVQLLDLNYNNLNQSDRHNIIWKLSLGSFNSSFQSLQSISLNLGFCRTLRDKDMCAFIKKLQDGDSFKNLKSLSLNFVECIELTNQTIQEFTTLFQKKKCFEEISLWTDLQLHYHPLIKEVKAQPNLKKLCIPVNLEYFKSDTFCQFMNLIKLGLFAVNNFGSKNQKLFREQNPLKVEALKIFANKSVNGQKVLEFLNDCKAEALKYLELGLKENISQVDLEVLFQFFTTCKNLIVLELSIREFENPEEALAPTQVDQFVRMIPKLPTSLRNLKISFNHFTCRCELFSEREESIRSVFLRSNIFNNLEDVDIRFEGIHFTNKKLN